MRRTALQRPAASRRLPVLLLVAPLGAACVPEGPTAIDPPGSVAHPAVSITAPADGARFPAGQEVRFTARGTDPEDGELDQATFVWTSSLDGQLGTGSELKSKDLSIGEHRITLTAIDPEGETATDRITIAIENNPPVAEIRDPDDGDSFREGRRVTFKGRGEDVEDGRLPDEALAWRSSLDGELGTGEELRTRELSVGTHTITLTVTDSHGDSATDEIEIEIRAFLDLLEL